MRNATAALLALILSTLGLLTLADANTVTLAVVVVTTIALAVLALHAIAQVQQAGGCAAFIDAEHALDVTYARALGVDFDRCLVSQPDHGEQALEIAEELARTDTVDLIVVDSVAALTPRAEIEGDMGAPHMGLQARLSCQIKFQTKTPFLKLPSPDL